MFTGAALSAVATLWVTTVPAAFPGSAPSFAKACETARDEGKLVFVYFSDPAHAQDAAYRELTWIDQGLRDWIAQHARAIEVSGDSEGDLRSRFDVPALPTVLLLSPAG